MTMPLSKEGIEQLKADLRANARRYNQSTFGELAGGEECGTECCMAGACHLRKVGAEEFMRQLGELAKERSRVCLDEQYKVEEQFMQACIAAGAVQLGIDDNHEWMPQIFAPVSDWPRDLYEAYRKASDAYDYQAKVEVACAALDRLNDDGTIKKGAIRGA
jgi:hypothetical protein